MYTTFCNNISSEIISTIKHVDTNFKFQNIHTMSLAFRKKDIAGTIMHKIYFQTKPNTQNSKHKLKSTYKLNKQKKS